MGRPLLADPDLPRKLATGGRVRRCISCENCIDSLEMRFSIDCAVNPLTGKEHELLPLPDADAAARRRGRRRPRRAWRPRGAPPRRATGSRCWRTTDQLGGALRLGLGRAPGERALPRLAARRGRRRGHRRATRLDASADADAVAALEPDAVVVATGGRSRCPSCRRRPAARAPRSPSLRAVAPRPAPPGPPGLRGRRVAWPASRVAEHLAARRPPRGAARSRAGAGARVRTEAAHRAPRPARPARRRPSTSGRRSTGSTPRASASRRTAATARLLRGRQRSSSPARPSPTWRCTTRSSPDCRTSRCTRSATAPARR